MGPEENNEILLLWTKVRPAEGLGRTAHVDERRAVANCFDACVPPSGGLLT